jgi:hypothetical protein
MFNICHVVFSVEQLKYINNVVLSANYSSLRWSVHNPFDSALYTMVNLNVQRFLLSLLPVITDQPAPILFESGGTKETITRVRAFTYGDRLLENFEVMWRVLSSTHIFRLNSSSKNSDIYRS